ncbi:MAG: hypothetical protein K0Q56_726 [Sporolactobacillus laevolacticus]|nr:hypothetical protein [Sporolactobacillus laevolacticus]
MMRCLLLRTSAVTPAIIAIAWIFAWFVPMIIGLKLNLLVT